MAGFLRRKSKFGAERDLISELPDDVKERILECLDTRDAAKTALLSTHWNKVWLSHGRLVFDMHFFESIPNRGGDEALSSLNIINRILSSRTGPIKKFTLDIYRIDPLPEQSDIDRWCLLLSRNGLQELHSSSPGRYKLPSCIVSCRTIKKLFIHGFIFDWHINARCIFPGATSLFFESVSFSDNVNGIAYDIPNLENLNINGCNGNSNFEINVPKLESICVIGDLEAIESGWFRLNFKSIKTLCLFTDLLENVEVAALPTAINLQVMKLLDISLCCGNYLTVAMQLLLKSPNLRVLEIAARDDLSLCDDMDTPSRLLEDPSDMDTHSRLLEDPSGCIIDQDLKMLHTIKIESFRGSTVEMLFVKTLLSKSPALERLVIRESPDMDTSMANKILRELVNFPRASTKAQVFFAGYDFMHCLVSFPVF